VCSVLETVSFHVRHDRVDELRGLLPIVTYMVFAPFMGAQPAAEFVREKIEAARAQAAPDPHP